ncbi:MAG: peptidoglycan-binding domain-containing protein [Candidatus Limiplasma sp.]|nr:peptidoglycan-binding domain-containing protein [Candidatus Limiplasma sp.]
MAKLTTDVGGRLRRSISLLLILCMVLSAAPAAMAASVGTTSSAVTDSTAMSFIKLTAAVNIFTTETTPASGAISVPAGTVLMLASTDTYTVTTTVTTTTPATTTTTEYGCVYYNSTRYNVKWSDISAMVMDTTAVQTYVVGTLWTTTDYPSLKPEMNLKRDVRVYGLQLALRTLGYYSGTLDGSYGTDTISGVKSFQKAYKLDVDGYAGPFTQKVLYPLAIASYNTSGSTIGNLTGTLTTTAKVNLRKSNSTKAVRLAVVPKKTTLAFSKTATSSGVMWYYVVYNNHSGWLMGTYTNLGSSGTSGGTTAVGTVTADSNVVVRKTANGSRTGYLLSKSSTATLLASPITSGGYTWYYIKLSNGVKGYVRGDYVTATYGGSSGVVDSTTKTYLKVGSAGLKIFTSEEESDTGAVTLTAGSIAQLVSTETYTKNTKVYGSLYYSNSRYNFVYANIATTDIMTAAALNTYITGTLWPAGYKYSINSDGNLVGDINVHACQYALSVLGYYTGALDGTFSSATKAAIYNFQRAYKLTRDGSAGPETIGALYPKAIAAISGASSTDFGTVNKVLKANWNFDNLGADLFPKYTSAQVMDVTSGKVFTIYRVYGKNHADCVPLTAADTKIMCDIIGFPYNSSHPSSTQLSAITNDAKNSNSTYTWPDFKGSWTTKTWNSGAWDRRPALLNVGGTVYCVSIYGWPHGYDGTDIICNYAGTNNYYGMMCVHFVNSETHVKGEVDAQHQANILTAYNYAKTLWPTKVQ